MYHRGGENPAKRLKSANMRTEEQQRQIECNGIRAAASEIGVTARTLQRWRGESYTARTEREGREVHRPRVVVNASQTAKSGAVILRAVYDAAGRQIWHAHRPKHRTAQELAELAEIERTAQELAEWYAE